MEPKTCPSCSFPTSDNFFFCPNCGRKLNEPPMTLSKQLGVYALSVFLPPLGLWPGLKYFFQQDPKIKKVGAIAIFLTILSTIITIWISIGAINSITSGVNSQLNQYQNLGY